jgi:hypothetical protein
MDNSTEHRFHPDRTLPVNGEIFVFGSNLAGRHGAGAALVAKQKFGAKAGRGTGYMYRNENRSCYAIPTKDADLSVLPLEEIRKYVDEFRMFTIYGQNKTFFVTRVGCGLAGYMDHEIAPMFAGFGPNVIFPDEWKPFVR